MGVYQAKIVDGRVETPQYVSEYQSIQKIGIDLSKFTEEQRKQFGELAADFKYGEQFFLLDDERFNKLT